MEKLGLYAEPKYNDVEYYLGEGQLTKQTEFIKYVASKIEGETDAEKIKNLILWMNKKIVRKYGQKDPKKFNKTAEEILESKERTGCSDSAVLFSTLARAMGIPTMQVVTFDKDWADDIIKDKTPNSTRGHFFVASYIKDIYGVENWVIIDSDKPVNKKEEIKLRILDKDNRNITNNNYAFAYARDFRDFEVDGKKIDSVQNMKYIQTKSCLESNLKDIDFEDKDIR